MANSIPQTELKAGFLEDHNGHSSSMRLMSAVALIASIAFGYITITTADADHQTGLYITTFFLIAAFCPKALQKFAEAKFPADNSSDS